MSSSQSVSTGKITFISGQIKEPIFHEVGLSFYRDLISFDKESFRIPVSSDSTFSMSFKLNEPTTAVLTYFGKSLKIYIEPGDKININFIGKEFPKSVHFTGEQAASNTYLKETAEQFSQWNEEFIYYEMSQKEPLEFRRLMDGIHQKKMKVYQSFPKDLKYNFSEAFVNYAIADIDYWWAYYLLRYRIEKPISAAQPVPMALPKTYFQFLNDLLISNDDALNNRNYLYFLEEYLNFRNEPNAPSLDSISTTSILVEVPSIFVLSEPEKPPVLTEIKAGFRLKYLNEKTDFTSKVLIKDALHEDYWFKVKTANGIVGWVVGVGLNFEEEGDFKVINTGADQKNKHKNARQFLFGNALQYTIANDIYWRSHVESKETLKEEVEHFLLNNPVNSYDQIIANNYKKINAPNKKERSSILYGPTLYKIVRDPVILSQKPTQLVKTALSSIKLDKKLEQTIRKSIPGDPNQIVSSVVLNALKAEKLKQNFDTNKKPQPKELISTSRDELSYVNIDPYPVERPSTPTNMKGTIKNHKGWPLKLVLFSDPIRFEERTQKIPLKNGKNFELHIDLEEPTIGRLSYGGETFDIYIEPGDNINLEFDAAYLEKTFFYRGRGDQHNNYLKDRTKLFREVDAQVTQKMQKSNPYEFVSFMDKCRNEKLKYYEDYNHAHSFSKAFSNYAKADIDYWYAYNLLNYPWESSLAPKDGPLQVPAEYYDFFRKIEIMNDGALPNQYYTYFLDQFFDYQKGLTENKGLTNRQLAEKFLQGDPLRYYQAKLFVADCKKGQAKQAGPFIQQFISENTNETYNDVLRLVYNDAKGLLKGDDAPDFSLVDINGNSVSLDQFKGKIIYLDFWATWCPPCVHSLRNSKQWKQNFAGKDVVFLYVSLDKDENSWKNFIRSQGIKGVHVIAGSKDVYQSMIARLYKVKRLPAAFLIDKAGKIYFNSSDKTARKSTTSEMINDLLLSN